MCAVTHRAKPYQLALLIKKSLDDIIGIQQSTVNYYEILNDQPSYKQILGQHTYVKYYVKSIPRLYSRLDVILLVQHRVHA